ncbi:MAG: GNAT family N-acetyltransferase [bacterium]|nr:GNAT family N-acetyltransferase [bacterium]
MSLSDPAKFLKDKAKLLRRQLKNATSLGSQTAALEAVAFSYTGKSWDWCAHQNRVGKLTIRPSDFSISRFLEYTRIPTEVGQLIEYRVFRWRKHNEPIDVIIQPATEADFQKILDWLQTEQDSEGLGFYGNRNIIADHFEEGELIVAKTKDDYPAGFITGPIAGPDILSVQSDFRNKGVGKKLIEYVIAAAREAGECAIKVDINPRTAIPFYKKLGFQVSESENARSVTGWLTLEKSMQLPAGTPVQLEIKFYPESKKWKETTEPLSTVFPNAIKIKNGLIHLSERVVFNYSNYSAVRDPVISISVNGNELYCDKAKYSEAKVLGVKRHSHGYYIETLRQPFEVIEYARAGKEVVASITNLQLFPNCNHLYTTLNRLFRKGQNHAEDWFDYTAEKNAFRKIEKKLGGMEANNSQDIGLDYCLKHGGVDGFIFALNTIPEFGDPILRQFFAKVLADLDPIVQKRFPGDETIQRAITALFEGKHAIQDPFYRIYAEKLDRTANMVRRTVEYALRSFGNLHARGFQYGVVEHAISAIVSSAGIESYNEQSSPEAKKLARSERARFKKLANQYFK